MVSSYIFLQSCRIQPSTDWIESQLPEIVKDGIFEVGDGGINGDEYDAEALVQAYVNGVTGACIALGISLSLCSYVPFQLVLGQFIVFIVEYIYGAPICLYLEGYADGLFLFLLSFYF